MLRELLVPRTMSGFSGGWSRAEKGGEGKVQWAVSQGQIRRSWESLAWPHGLVVMNSILESHRLACILTLPFPGCATSPHHLGLIHLFFFFLTPPPQFRDGGLSSWERHLYCVLITMGTCGGSCLRRCSPASHELPKGWEHVLLTVRSSAWLRVGTG